VSGGGVEDRAGEPLDAALAWSCLSQVWICHELAEQPGAPLSLRDAPGWDGNVSKLSERDGAASVLGNFGNAERQQSEQVHVFSTPDRAGITSKAEKKWLCGAKRRQLGRHRLGVNASQAYHLRLRRAQDASLMCSLPILGILGRMLGTILGTCDPRKPASPLALALIFGTLAHRLKEN
jgi:hypothetical protein